MQRTALASLEPRSSIGRSGAWLDRRWYYTPRTHRTYSVRQISPGDRRMLADFILGLSRAPAERDLAAVPALASLMFDRVIAVEPPAAVGFAALENTSSGDRVIGVSAYALIEEGANFGVAVSSAFRREQVGQTLLATLLRQARHAGVRQVDAQMHWSNRPMQRLAASLGFRIDPVAQDRNLRRLSLKLR